MRQSKTLYKVLGPDGQSIHGGKLQWSLPTKTGCKWTPGDWHKVGMPVKVCCTGLHLTDNPWQTWVRWDSRIFIAEGAGNSDSLGDKTAFQSARLLRPARLPKWWRNAQQFAIGIPAALKWFEPDGRPLDSWEVYESQAAARDAAWKAASWNAALTAAWDAASYAAWAAGRRAARAAAWYAVCDAAWDTGRRAARAAACDAARAAARDAVRTATRDAALYAQCVSICDGTNIDKKHIQHARERWEVWTRGYGCAADVNGVLYVYRRLT